MTGIFLIFVLIVWFLFVRWLTIFAVGRIENKILHSLIRILLFSGLMVLPLADELVGRAQFKALCEKSQQVYINMDKTRSRTVTILDPVSGKLILHERSIQNVALPMTEKVFFWSDVKTGELIISYKRLDVRGGLLIRSLGISETNSPLLIGKASCMPDVSRIFSEFDLKKSK